MIYLPTLIYSERDCVSKHGKLLAATGCKAMIVTGRESSKKNGSLDMVTEVLKKEGRDYVVFDEIEENPSVETIMRARKIGIIEKVDFIIGVGGGSPLDASKAIAVMIANPTWDESILYNNAMARYLPVVTVPTTAGTGSEVTPYAILTLHENRTKKSISHKVYPVLALIDYTYLKTQPQEVLINTSVDALAHLVESYLNTNADDLNRMYSDRGLRMFGEIKDRLKNPDDEVYKKLSDIAMIAGMAITHTGTSIPHGLSYGITYELGVPHGKAVGMFLGKYVKLYKDVEESRKVLELLGMEDYDSFIQYVNKLLGIVEISSELVVSNATKMYQNKEKLRNYPFEITKEELINLL